MAIARIPNTPDQQVAYWSGELERAKKRFKTFWDNGDKVVDEYRLQKSDGNDAGSRDKFNILYSSTETIRPNLYAQQPLSRVVLRNTDSATPEARAAAMLLEGCLKYIQDEEDLDELMHGVVEDYLLPGLGVAWARYEARFEDKKDDAGKPVVGADGKTPQQTLLDEMVRIEYVYWQDFLTGVSRTWKENPWVAKRLWLTKERATERFGADKANTLTYATREASGRELDNPTETAEVWEIWNKPNKTVYWYGEGLTELLDTKPDPLKLKNFFPCPRPLRAISNTRTFVPRALYSQYKSQAETLNVLTKRIRLLGEALRVVGLYDGSNPKLADLLSPQAGNRMIAVDGWAMFAQNGGIDGSVQWLPIDQIVQALNELLKAREVCKQEIYEVTGFSDIVRGVSKASETLGAQNLKADWAGARVKKMQKDVQRFVKDLLALAGELIAEHCAPETIAVFSGMQIPTPEQLQSDAQGQAKIKLFMDACTLIRDEMRRVSVIDIETDSTLLANTEAEREDRAKFLAAAGAFLQQAVPAMEATPELGPLLGAMLMFTVRSFPSARIIEDEFEKVQQAMAARKPDEDKGGEKAKAAAEQARVQAETQYKQAQLAQTAQKDQATLALDTQKEQNRHAEKMAELELKAREVQVREGELVVKQEVAKTDKFKAVHDAGIKEEGLKVEEKVAEADAENAEADRQADLFDREADREASREEAEASREQEYDRMDRDETARDADREAQEAAQAASADKKGDDA